MRSGITDRTDVGQVRDRECGDKLKISDGDASSEAGEADTNARGIAVVPFCVALRLAAGCPSASWPHGCGIAAIRGPLVVETSWQD